MKTSVHKYTCEERVYVMGVFIRWHQVSLFFCVPLSSFLWSSTLKTTFSCNILKISQTILLKKVVYFSQIFNIKCYFFAISMTFWFWKHILLVFLSVNSRFGILLPVEKRISMSLTQLADYCKTSGLRKWESLTTFEYNLLNWLKFTKTIFYVIPIHRLVQDLEIFWELVLNNREAVRRVCTEINYPKSFKHSRASMFGRVAQTTGTARTL